MSDEMLDLIYGENKTWTSVNRLISENGSGILQFPVEFLNGLKGPLYDVQQGPETYAGEGWNISTQEMEDDKLRTFAPCVEKPNETAFLTKSPIEIITSGDYNKVPMIIGYNSNEGLIVALADILLPAPRDTDIRYERFIPYQMNLSADSDLRKEICEKLRSVYSNEQTGDRYLIHGDYLFVAGIIGLTENFARTCSEPIFTHRLRLDTSRNFYKKILRSEAPGATHADDLGYFFDRGSEFSPKIPVVPGSIEDKAIRRYIRLWGNFMKYGNPTPNSSEFGLIWKPVTKDILYCLDVDEEISLVTNPDLERIEVWRNIYKSHENTKNFLV